MEVLFKGLITQIAAIIDSLWSFVIVLCAATRRQQAVLRSSSLAGWFPAHAQEEPSRVNGGYLIIQVIRQLFLYLFFFFLMLLRKWLFACEGVTFQQIDN